MSKPKPWVKFEELSKNSGRFIVSPLERGMGVTLGNSMRRVLLASLPGVGVTSVKIDGAKHEYSTLPGVVEDVVDIINNIKGVVFKGEVEEPIKLRIDFKGKGSVTAKEISQNSEVEVINPDHHIAELSESGKLTIDLSVEMGMGFRASEEDLKSQDKELEVDEIVIDTSFSPITRVNHVVEAIRVGKELNYDSLTLDVWTNGSINPEEAAKVASQTLLDKFCLFGAVNQEPVVEVEEAVSEVNDETSSALDLTIDDLELSARSSNCLKRAGIETVAELIEKDMSELIKIKNFGKKSADEINDKLKQFSLSLKGSN